MFMVAMSRSCCALAVGQPRVQLAGLGVDEVGGQRAGVAAEQRVRQRAVAPEEPGEVQPDEQAGQRVEQPDPQLGQVAPGEQRAVGLRELQMPGDQQSAELLAVVGDAIDHRAVGLDDRHAVLGEFDAAGRARAARTGRWPP